MKSKLYWFKILANEIFAVGYGHDKESTYLATNNWVYMMKHSLSMIKYLFMNYLPIFSRWLWKYVGYIINISLHSQIIGSYFWWYLYSILSFQQTKYSLSATDWVRNPTTLLRIIRKSLFFFQQWACSIEKLSSNADELIQWLKVSIFEFLLSIQLNT